MAADTLADLSQGRGHPPVRGYALTSTTCWHPQKLAEAVTGTAATTADHVSPGLASLQGDASSNGAEPHPSGQPSPSQRSISSMTTEQWRSRYEQDGCVDLWVEEEFNAGSRLVVSQRSALCCCLFTGGPA